MKQRVLFLCSGNSCRSQMAEGLLRHLAGDRYDVVSAGKQPAGLDPGAVEAMNEIGVDISQQRSKKVDEFLGQRFDYAITVGDRAKDSYRFFPGWGPMMLQHWNIDDPAAAERTLEERRAVFRRVRDEISDRIRQFVAEGRHSGDAARPVGCFGRYIVRWILAGLVPPFVLSWALSLPNSLLTWKFPPGTVLELGHWLIHITVALWPSSILVWGLWEGGHLMPGLLRFPLFWGSIGINVVVYQLVGLVWWNTPGRYRWIGYLVGGLWIAVCLLLPSLWWVLR